MLLSLSNIFLQSNILPIMDYCVYELEETSIELVQLYALKYRERLFGFFDHDNEV